MGFLNSVKGLFTRKRGESYKNYMERKAAERAASRASTGSNASSVVYNENVPEFINWGAVPGRQPVSPTLPTSGLKKNYFGGKKSRKGRSVSSRKASLRKASCRKASRRSASRRVSRKNRKVRR